MFTKKGPSRYKGVGKFGDRKRPGVWKAGGDRPELFSATCNECGQECEVPFRPNGSKPVYCRNCFRKDEGGDRKPSFEKPAYRSTPRVPSNDEVVRELRALNAKMNEVLQALMDLAAKS